MVTIGLTGWSDHDSLLQSKKLTLADYAAHFPVVEVIRVFMRFLLREQRQTGRRKLRMNFVL
ncbi:Uncharacterised protein [Listeria monocytogenes]|nr:Uncharacterised protein [Listeria monocytogenes]CWV88080.1 Uncharacterised protein [Listeria monocytogenes]CWV93123.1 Uncharacterised protein [Listeria monocytogenes]CWV97027.1 Uncharacterised protein [Listeria monocytogenes]CWX02712.1 Uncharacterised protein [Listeria monocytogenes]